MKIAISVDSAADMPPALLQKLNVYSLPFTVLLGNETYFDGEISTDDMIAFVTKNKILPKTSCINEFQYQEHFEKILKEYDAVLHFSLASNLSVSYQNAVNAAKNYTHVRVFDSKTLSAGISLEAMYAKKLVDAGEEYDSVIQKVERRIPAVQVSSVIDKLDYLYMGGRCSALKRFGANLLKLKPQIVVKDGKITSGKIYRGKYAAVVKKYVEDTLKIYDTPDLENAFIAYTTTAEPNVIEEVKSVLLKRGFKNVYVTQAGATVTSHCGENTLGIYYINDGFSEK